ncbi:serine/threonine-protein kinase 16 [Schistocerca gregaria]|uniref:serine/threonine-protein kinase 16 n=1 Tax=Schistocerca gregaria TaxID=7010 RepID=UPI00211EF5FB|nr:serine/threonine-protein kinase 16 [Schistocerca gregaria]
MFYECVVKMGCACSRTKIAVGGKTYTVQEHLADGGFSSIYLVQDSKSHRLCVLKKIVCHAKEDQMKALQEVAYYGLIKHPNVIECLDSGVSGEADAFSNYTSEVYILLPYYKRGTLADELLRRSRNCDYLPAMDVLTMFLQICEGVKAFHEALPEPLAHRDLKTANILIGEGNRPIIMDLGSMSTARIKICGSSEAQKLQDTAGEMCSMPYRAPELFNVESYCMVDERTDIWSLGCVLYAMCFFKSPFDVVYERGDSVALAVISGTVSFPDNSPYDQDLHDLILYMLKVNPMERPYIYSVIEKTHDVISKLQCVA